MSKASRDVRALLVGTEAQVMRRDEKSPEKSASAGSVDVAAFLEEARSGPEQTLLALDFDGTISAIAPSPDEAVVDPAIKACLERASGRFPIWIISGRDADQVRDLVGLPGAGYVGAHGLEALDEGGLRPLAPVGDVGARLDVLAQAVIAELPEIAPHVERKRWSVAFHYRSLSLSAREVDRLRRTIDAHLHPDLRVRSGKMVLEALPAVEHDKGAALEWLLSSVAPMRVLVAGDDLTDVAMFEVLAARRANGDIDGLSVAVRHGAETPEALLEVADTAVDGVAGLHRLLEELLGGT